MRLLLTCLVSCILFSTSAFARNDVLEFPIEPLLSSGKAKGVLLDVPIYFAGQSHKKATKVWGEISTNKKTNAAFKPDQEACEWVLLSALKALQEKAKQNGMNAVIDIKSNYNHIEFVSSSKFKCGAGNIMAGVALKGTLATLP